jgi:hypothetical protein
VLGGVSFMGAWSGVWFRARVRDDEAARTADRRGP